MFDFYRRPSSSLVERLSLALTVLAVLATFVSGVLVLRGAARLLASQQSARHSGEVVVQTSAMSDAATGDLCVDSAQPLLYAPSVVPPVACPDGVALR